MAHYRRNSRRRRRERLLSRVEWALKQAPFQFLTVEDCRELAELAPDSLPSPVGVDSAQPDIWPKLAAAGLERKVGVLETRCAKYQGKYHSVWAYGPICLKEDAGVNCRSCGLKE